MSALIEKMQELTDRFMLDDGDTSSTSQKICITNAIYEVDHAVNGVSSADVK